jgi:hypothetical protein
MKPRLWNVHEEPGQKVLAIEGFAIGPRGLLVAVPSDGPVEIHRARGRDVRGREVA